jgi:hypothetical protein
MAIVRFTAGCAGPFLRCFAALVVEDILELLTNFLSQKLLTSSPSTSIELGGIISCTTSSKRATYRLVLVVKALTISR